ncbi:MAG: GFA family protein [Woeseiaceae bacterium]
MTDSYPGSCLCGAVKFEIDEFLPQAAHCHCSMCRKFHGASYTTFATVHRSKFRWVEGEDALKVYTAKNDTTRTFCRHCGSSLAFFSPRASQEEVEIALGTMDTDVPVKPSAHIFVRSAANWTVLDDDLPLYEDQRGSAKIDR